MIPRYTPEDLGALWTDAHRFRTWLAVELAVVDALAESGALPMEDATDLHAIAKTVDFEALAARALVLEQTAQHDVIAFLTAFEEIAGPVSRHVHFGLTSSDVVDTSLALIFGQALSII